MSLLGGDNIIGNEALRARLYSDIKSGSLAHAYIIEGKRGSGRHTLVKNIIAALACAGDGDTIPCGECLNCRHVFEDKCPDVMTVSREEDRATMGVDTIRELKESLWAVPNDLEFKSYIIEDADTMTVQAQNAFLLTLEQPPRFVSFFLICENARSLLETIRSRAPVLRTEPIPAEKISEYIRSDSFDKKLRDAARALQQSEPEEFATVLISADGSIGRAAELLSPRTRKPISDRRALAMTFIESLTINGKKDHPLSLFPKFSQKRDELSLQLEYISRALRDLILLKKSENAPLCFFADRERALDLSGSFFERKLISVFDKITEAKDSVERSANIRLTLIDLLASV